MLWIAWAAALAVARKRIDDNRRLALACRIMGHAATRPRRGGLCLPAAKS